MKISRKIGLHIEGGTSVPLVSPTGVSPTVVKLVNVSPEYVAQVRKQVGPNTLIVIRWTEAEQPLDNPVENARRWFDRRRRQMEEIDPNRGYLDDIVAFEGYNEIPDELASAYCAFEIERLRLMHEAEFNSVIGNFSIGTPDFPVWAVYKPMLDAMGPGDYLGLHEYWANWRDMSNTYHLLRFTRPEVEPFLRGKRIILTECGRDRIEDGGLPSGEWGYRGWRADPECTPEKYAEELWELGTALDRHDLVVGACVFGVGGFGWGDFDVTGLWPRVVAEYEPEPVEPPAERWETVNVCEFDAGDEHLRSTIERKVR